MRNDSILRRIKIKRSNPTTKSKYSKFYKRYKFLYWGAFSLIIIQSLLILSGTVSVLSGSNGGWFSIIINSIFIPLNINTMISCKKSMRKEEEDIIKTESEKFNF